MSYPFSPSNKPLLGRYDIISPRLGSGAFGTIALGRDIKTSELVAIKTIPDNEWDETEHKSLAELSHPNVLRLRQYCHVGGQHYLVTDYLAGGDLFDFLEGKPYIEEDIVRPLFCQIVACTEFFHRAGYAHRDLKLENIFLDKDRKNITIGDWGFSVRFTPGLPTLRERCGTLFYLAPEMIAGAGYQGPEVDMWSLGVLLYYLLVGFLPFDAGTNEETERLILLASPDIPDRLSPEAQDLLRCLFRPAQERLTAVQTLAHPWLQGHPMALSASSSSSSSSPFPSFQTKRVTSYRPASSSSTTQTKRSRPIISSSTKSFFEDSPFDCLLGASLDDLSSSLSCCPPALDRCLNPCLPQTNTVC